MEERLERTIICPLSLSWGGGAENSMPELERWWLGWMARITGSTEINSNMQLVWLQIWGEEGGRRRKKEGVEGGGRQRELNGGGGGREAMYVSNIRTSGSSC